MKGKLIDSKYVAGNFTLEKLAIKLVKENKNLLTDSSDVTFEGQIPSA